MINSFKSQQQYNKLRICIYRHRDAVSFKHH